MRKGAPSFGSACSHRRAALKRRRHKVRTRNAYMPSQLSRSDCASSNMIRGCFRDSHWMHAECNCLWVSLPQGSSGSGDLLIDIPALVHSVEEKSCAECRRLRP